MQGDQELIELLDLDGHPNVQRLGAISVGETPIEKLNLALDLECAAIVRLNRGIARCTERADNGTRQLLEEILSGEEEHADWLESQVDLIGHLSEAQYLAQQIHD